MKNLIHSLSIDNKSTPIVSLCISPISVIAKSLEDTDHNPKLTVESNYEDFSEYDIQEINNAIHFGF